MSDNKLKPITITILNNTIDLDTECWNCKGTGQGINEIYSFGDGSCRLCLGRGRVMTEAGQAIYDVIERYLAGSTDHLEIE